MTERGASRLTRSSGHLAIGRSSVQKIGRDFQFNIDERGAPIPRAVKGELTLEPFERGCAPFELDRSAHHFWQPLAPVARVRVAFDEPAIRWTGWAYFDSNWGDSPLEDTFSRWDWSRCLEPERTTVFYDVERRHDAPLALSIAFGSVQDQPREAHILGRQALPRTAWGIDSAVRCDQGQTPQRVLSLEDTPFYSRSLVAASQRGQPVTMMHESLSLDRFRSRWVQTLLHCRMPRIR
jgi:carotenoid 1,2-hydratase